MPIDDSASKWVLRSFTIGRQNRITINTVLRTQTSAVIYSITETTRANNLNVYYNKHLLTELPQMLDADGNIDEVKLEPLMSWSKTLPTNCYSKRYN